MLEEIPNKQQLWIKVASKDMRWTLSEMSRAILCSEIVDDVAQHRREEIIQNSYWKWPAVYRKLVLHAMSGLVFIYKVMTFNSTASPES